MNPGNPWYGPWQPLDMNWPWQPLSINPANPFIWTDVGNPLIWTLATPWYEPTLATPWYECTLATPCVNKPWQPLDMNWPCQPLDTSWSRQPLDKNSYFTPPPTPFTASPESRGVRTPLCMQQIHLHLETSEPDSGGTHAQVTNHWPIIAVLAQRDVRHHFFLLSSTRLATTTCLNDTESAFAFRACCWLDEWKQQALHWLCDCYRLAEWKQHDSY